MLLRNSDITCTDMFCGAGGSSIGAHESGVNVRLAMNHWKLAIETHNTNFQNTDHACTDIQACDPRRYYRTNILIASPECTNHSLAKGVQRKRSQIDAFADAIAKPEEERSRATMWDVPRFAEVHKYEIVIVENVPDARHWVMFDAWLMAMHSLGYLHKCVFLNSMFMHPTPQSRDRMYVVFWKKGNPMPDVIHRPPAPCAKCGVVESVQSWKPNREWGRYKRQYEYCCPKCAAIVDPFYFAAINAIDFSLPAERIGDRKQPLRDRTRARIQYGLEKFGRKPLVVRTRMTGATPFMVNTSHSAADARAQSVVQALPTQTTAQEQALAIPPGFVMTYRNQPDVGYHIKSLTQPLSTVVGSSQERLILAPAALVTLRDSARTEGLVRGLNEPLGTQVATCTQDFIVSPSRFLVQFYGQSNASELGEPIPTVTTLDRHALVETPTPDIDDCYFRMLQPHEVGAAMAFPSSYTVLGTKRDKVKQYGNAVTPPAMKFLIDRCVVSLAKERAA